MSLPRLNDRNVLNVKARQPAYTPANHRAGIVHIGPGAFHRAHQAVMADAALAQEGGDWRIVGVSLRSRDLADSLNPQDGLYTLIERGKDGASARIIGAIERVIAVDPVATLNAICDPSIRIVTLTVTEKGYGIDLARRMPDASNPVVAADLAAPDTPRGVLGLLTLAAKRRKAAALAPLTVLSCDNLPENGKVLRGGVIGFARMSGQEDLAEWIKDNMAFPCSMVDRITPAPTQATLKDAMAAIGCRDDAAVETEPFMHWVIEDDFPSGRPAWEAGGAVFVTDVTPYERMKLTMLNGSHSLLAYSGFLLGRRYVRDVMTDPGLVWLVKRHLKAAAALLPDLAGVDFDVYAKDLIERFSNPAIAHETFQIATDGTQKLPQRIFDPAMTALDCGQSVTPFAFATAMWIRFCVGKRDDGTAYDLPDLRAAELTSAIGRSAADAAALSNAIHALPNLVPPHLASNAMWRREVETILSSVLQLGCRAAIQQLTRKEEAPLASV